MGGFIANQVVNCMVQNSITVKNSKILLLGITFKENCPDIRNTKVMEIRKHLLNYTDHIEVFDPYADAEEVEKEYGFRIITDWEALKDRKFNAIVHCVSHDLFAQVDLKSRLVENGIIYDVNGTLDRSLVTRRL